MTFISYTAKTVINIRNSKLNNERRRNGIFMQSMQITLVGVISKIIPFITFPLLTKIYSVEEIGQIDFILSLAMTATTLAIIGQDSSIVRFYNEDQNENRKVTLVSSIVATLLLNSILLYLAYSIIDNKLSIFNISENNIDEVWVLFLIIGFAWSSIVDASLRSQDNIRQYISYIIWYNGIINLPVLWLYFVRKIDIVEYLHLYSVCVLTSGIISLLYVRKYIVLSQLQICSSRLIKYGWPLMAVSAVSLMQPLIERVLIKVMISDLDLGLYSVSLKLLMLVQLPLSLLANALLIEIIKLSKKEGGGLTIRKITKLYIYSASAIFLIFIMSIDYIVLHLYDSRYAATSIYATMLALGVYVYNVGGIYSSGLILAEKTRYKLFSALIASLLSIGLGYTLVPLIGIIAIPFAFILSRCVSIVFEIRFSYVYCQIIIREWRDVNVLLIATDIFSLIVLWKLTIFL